VGANIHLSQRGAPNNFGFPLTNLLKFIYKEV